MLRGTLANRTAFGPRKEAQGPSERKTKSSPSRPSSLIFPTKTDCGGGSHLPRLRAVRASPSPLPQRLLPVARSSVAPYCAFPRINDAGSNAFPHLCAASSNAFHRTDAAGSTAYPSSTPLVLSTPGRAAALSPLLDVKRSAALRVRIQCFGQRRHQQVIPMGS
ncbi:hypothetical protein BS78_01G264200 [Paspalum vaginatum]|nr:hypothetical protein BS78_01G264200 [Paspalum vaginatum]KAJ1295984.1 hypothetical protein BS78_01G264200 [Paspalum vaginatum]